MRIDTVVLPVAGLGTRFLPATKSIPKEMIPVLDKPVIQYALEEAAEAGIRHAVLVSSPAKFALEDHFDCNPELEATLQAKAKTDMLNAVRNTLPNGMRVTVVRQGRPLGLGHAISCAHHVVGDKPFAVMLPDDFIWSPERACMADMIDLHRERGCYSIAVEEVPLEATDKYGIATLMDTTFGAKRIVELVEKPKPEFAPSRLAVVGRYVLPASIWAALKALRPGAGGELQLTDAIQMVLGDSCIVAHRFVGRRFDCGTKVGFLEANAALALADPVLSVHYRRFLTAELARLDRSTPTLRTATD